MVKLHRKRFVFIQAVTATVLQLDERASDRFKKLILKNFKIHENCSKNSENLLFKFVRHLSSAKLHYSAVFNEDEFLQFENYLSVMYSTTG